MKRGGREAHVPVRGGIQVGIPCGQLVGHCVALWTNHNGIFCGGNGGIHFLAWTFGTELIIISRLITGRSSRCGASAVSRRHALYSLYLCRLLITAQNKWDVENTVIRAIEAEKNDGD